MKNILKILRVLIYMIIFPLLVVLYFIYLLSRSLADTTQEIIDDLKKFCKDIR